MFNINFADDWIRTADLWYQKQLLYQLTHNHIPHLSTVISSCRMSGGGSVIIRNPKTSTRQDLSADYKNQEIIQVNVGLNGTNVFVKSSRAEAASSVYFGSPQSRNYAYYTKYIFLNLVNRPLFHLLSFFKYS